MAVILFPLCFICVFLILGISTRELSKKEVFLGTILTLSTLVILITEVLSALHLITFAGIFTSWSAIFFLGIGYLYTKRIEALNYTKSIRQHIGQVYTVLSRKDKYLLATVGIIMVLVLGQGIIYPPNNYDSMTY